MFYIFAVWVWGGHRGDLEKNKRIYMPFYGHLVIKSSLLF